MKKSLKHKAKETGPQGYDFAGGIRGKYAEAYAQGTNVVLLDPDVAKAFRTAKAVNRALRNLLAARPA